MVNTDITNSILNDPDWLAFCKSHNIAPFEISEETIDLDSSLLQDLQDSFKTGGYNYNIPS
jgi:hypothetical protein